MSNTAQKLDPIDASFAPDEVSSPRPSTLSEAVGGTSASPVAALQGSIEKAYRHNDMAHSEIERGPFALGLTLLAGISLVVWVGIAWVLHSLL